MDDKKEKRRRKTTYRPAAGFAAGKKVSLAVHIKGLHTVRWHESRSD